MKHMGAINSDAVLRPYEQAYADMTAKYRIDPNERVPLWQRAWRWLLSKIYT